MGCAQPFFSPVSVDTGGAHRASAWQSIKHEHAKSIFVGCFLQLDVDGVCCGVRRSSGLCLD